MSPAGFYPANTLEGDILIIGNDALRWEQRMEAASRLANELPFRKPIIRQEWEAWRATLDEGKDARAVSMQMAGLVASGLRTSRADIDRIGSDDRKQADEYARVVAIVAAILDARRAQTVFARVDGGRRKFENVVPWELPWPNFLSWLHAEVRRGYKEALWPGFGALKEEIRQQRRYEIEVLGWEDLDLSLRESRWLSASETISSNSIRTDPRNRRTPLVAIVGADESPVEREVIARVMLDQHTSGKERADLQFRARGWAGEEISRRAGRSRSYSDVRLSRPRDRLPKDVVRELAEISRYPWEEDTSAAA